MTKISYQTIRDLLFADDCVLLAHTLEEIQTIVSRFAAAAKTFGLTISIKKTELLFQPLPGSISNTIPTVFVDDKPLKTVSAFTYLGSTVTKDVKLDMEIESRIRKASSAFGKLYNRLWNCHDVTIRTKIDIYRAVVLTSLLYGAESWTPYRKHINLLNSFHMRCLKQICNVKWDDKIKNSRVLSLCNISGIEAFLIRIQMRWCGHVYRMNDDRIPKQIFFGQLRNSKQRVSRPLLRYKDKFQDNLKRLSIGICDWEGIADKRDEWRSTCFNKLLNFEENRVQHHDILYESRKEKHQDGKLSKL